MKGERSTRQPVAKARHGVERRHRFSNGHCTWKHRTAQPRHTKRSCPRPPAPANERRRHAGMRRSGTERNDKQSLPPRTVQARRTQKQLSLDTTREVGEIARVADTPIRQPRRRDSGAAEQCASLLCRSGNRRQKNPRKRPAQGPQRSQSKTSQKSTGNAQYPKNSKNTTSENPRRALLRSQKQHF